jgi:hypothetical protein
MLVRQEGMRIGDPEHLGEHRRGDVAREEAVPILAEHRGHPDRVVGLEADEPAVQ